MKHFTLLLIIFSLLTLTGCNKNDDDPEPTPPPVETKAVLKLYHENGTFIPEGGTAKVGETIWCDGRESTNVINWSLCFEQLNCIGLPVNGGPDAPYYGEPIYFSHSWNKTGSYPVLLQINTDDFENYSDATSTVIIVP